MLQTSLYRNRVLIEESQQNSINYKINKIGKNDQGEYICYGYTADRSVYSYKSIKVIVGE